MQDTYVLNGVTYTFKTMPATVALDMTYIFIKYIAVGVKGLDVAALLKDVPKDAPKKEMFKVLLASSGILESIGDVIASLEKPDLDDIIRMSKDYFFVGNDRCNVDTHFTGKILDFFKVLGMFLRYNFKDFFTEKLSTLAQEQQQKTV